MRPQVVPYSSSQGAACARRLIASLPGLLTRGTPASSNLLTALSRSRHFRPPESGVGREIGSPGAAHRSQFHRQRTSP